jgi:putative endonuclease
MFHCYILYSKYLDRYYIGATSLTTEERIENHLSKYYSDIKFTAKADDWVIFLVIPCSSFSQARRIESHI